MLVGTQNIRNNAARIGGLDAAVLAAYGFSAKADLLEQLLALNTTVADRLSQQQPVTAPGIPASHAPKAKGPVAQVSLGDSQPETLLSGNCLGGIHG